MLPKGKRSDVSLTTSHLAQLRLEIIPSPPPGPPEAAWLKSQQRPGCTGALQLKKMIFWPSLVVASFPKSFKGLLVFSPQRGLGANFFRDCVPGVRGKAKLQPVSVTCSRHWEHPYTVCGHFCLSKKMGGMGHFLRHEWSFFYK